MWRIVHLLRRLASWPSMKKLVFGAEDSQLVPTDFGQLECVVEFEQAVNRFAFADDALVLQKHNLFCGDSHEVVWNSVPTLQMLAKISS